MSVNKPAYWKAIVPDEHRRATWHDYRSPSTYMITVGACEGAPDFGFLVDSCIELSDAGKIVANEIQTTPIHNPAVEVVSFVIMPDHFHVLLRVRQRMSKTIGDVVQAIKSVCTRRIRERFNDAELTVFQPGFHDRIVRDTAQLQTLQRYIQDNPRRLMIKRRFPDLLKKVCNIQIGDYQCTAVGNVFLLRDFDKKAVIIHRSLSAEKKKEQFESLIRFSRSGGVLISAFISKDEKFVRDRAIEGGGRIIHLCNEGFSTKYKPTGIEFELCSQGRLLKLSPHEYSTRYIPLKREHALMLNSLARCIESADYTLPLRYRSSSTDNNQHIEK